MGWLGLDDTDSLEQGCTTYTFHQLLEGLPSSVQVQTPRLVRLWPFAQQRTRGNAAVAVELITDDEPQLIEYLENFWNMNISDLAGRVSKSEHDGRAQHPSDPGMVWFSSQRPDDSFYLDSVRREVSLHDVPPASCSWGGMGRIGATAAVSWREGKPTWEAIVWRSQERHGQNERRVCESTLKQIDALPSTFLSRDPRRGTSLIAPRGPCPVLFGVRARDAETAKFAGSALREAEEETNDDFESLYKGQVSKSGVAILPSKRTRRIPEVKKPSLDDEALSELKAEQPEIKEVEAIAVLEEPAEMTAEEYKAMVELARNAGPEDCEMCGS